MLTDEELFAIKERAEEHLLKLQDVHAVGLGSKEVAGRPTGEICIKIFTSRKRSKQELSPDEIIPSEFEGVQTDIVQVEPPKLDLIPGALKEDEDSSRYRPLRGGTQINRKGMGLGTLGCFLKVSGDNKRVMAMTNHHVLFDACSDPFTAAKAGQPTATESCTACCSGVIGSISKALCNADLDIALVQLDAGQKWLAEIEGIGTVAGMHTITVAEAATGTFQVQKRGRTTRLTGGAVSAIGVSGRVNNHDGTKHRDYQNAITITPNPNQSEPEAEVYFSRPGDSGSAVLDSSRNVVGVLFAGGGGSTEAIPIDRIISGFSAVGLSLEVATATTSGAVQTVPAAQPAADAGSDAVPVMTQTNEVGARIEADLSTSEAGRWYFDLYMRHLDEVNTLINTNRHVTVTWHRSGGGVLFQSLVRAFHNPAYTVPEEVNGRSVREILAEVYEVLNRYGSEALRRDLVLLKPNVPSFAGLSYPGIIHSLNSVNPLYTTH